MPFNINEFTSQINRSGFAKLSDFEVEMPNIFDDEVGGDHLRYRIASIDIPPRSITFSDYRDYGVPYKIPTQANFIDVTMQVICSHDYCEREYFLKWQDLIVGKHRRSDNNNASEVRRQWDIAYYNDIVRTITIKNYSEDGKTKYEIKLIDAFPALVGNMTMSWSTPEFAIFPVTINYRYFQDRAACHKDRLVTEGAELNRLVSNNAELNRLVNEDEKLNRLVSRR